MKDILIVDDDPKVRLAISVNLKDSGFVPVEASSGENAVNLFNDARPSAVLLDLKMPGIGGLMTLREMKQIDASIPIIIITSHGDIPQAVEAIKLGAYDFICKPPDFERLAVTLKRATERELENGVHRLNAEIETSLEYILGASPVMKDIIRQVYQVAGSDFSLIIQGETGTGKSFLARAIHNLGRRAKGPFITVDIGAIPEALVESELFGYEKGAFTGAERRKKGFFEIADKGTLLIDEVQNMSPYVQSKLLAAVEEKRIYPLGSSLPATVDVRIIGASNSDIKTMVLEKKFREDLFYRLGEFIISLPPLRQRKEDIPDLAEKFYKEAAENLNKQVLGLSDDVLKLLKQHSWPGNIRELKNVIRRAALLAGDTTVHSRDIRFFVPERRLAESAEQPTTPGMRLPSLNLVGVEKYAIQQALESTSGNKTRAAVLLQIDYSTLLRKIKQYGISLSH
ncbi:MAG: sigma-54-dependent transcriptional regulator [bacterium]